LSPFCGALPQLKSGYLERGFEGLVLTEQKSWQPGAEAECCDRESTQDVSSCESGVFCSTHQFAGL
jgi:hypothetical protein